MGILKSIKSIIEGWKKIDNPPDWVQEAYYKWEEKLPTHPYNMIKHL